MGYQVTLRIQPASAGKQRKQPDYQQALDLLKTSTYLTHNEATRLLAKQQQGAEIWIHPRAAADPAECFAIAAKLEMLGLKVNVRCWLSGHDVPYLVNDRGVVPDSTIIAQRYISIAEVEALLWNTNAPLIIDKGILRWISDAEKFRCWEEQIKPQWVDIQHPQTDKDYPLYHTEAWETAAGATVIIAVVWD